MEFNGLSLLRMNGLEVMNDRDNIQNARVRRSSSVSLNLKIKGAGDAVDDHHRPRRRLACRLLAAGNVAGMVERGLDELMIDALIHVAYDQPKLLNRAMSMKTTSAESFAE